MLKVKITETEAYAGMDDPACHASNGKRTPRTMPFYEPGGIAYVYIIYGIHFMFNVITNLEDCADAVLIRAGEPIEDLDTMLVNRKFNHVTHKLTNRPGVLCIALGITKDDNMESLQGNRIWIENAPSVRSSDLLIGSRINIGPAGDYAIAKPWRFRLRTSKFIGPDALYH